jgi:hypothetical protein
MQPAREASSANLWRAGIPGRRTNLKPLTASLFFMAIVAAMGYELSQDVLRASRLSDDLRDSEERMNLEAEAANLGMWCGMWRETRFG